jgi:putative exporter of polyketide antibiotics
MDFSPFSHSPLLPGPDAELTGMVWLTIIAGALLAGGSAAFRGRDLAT